jgi:hypothetical protein
MASSSRLTSHRAEMKISRRRSAQIGPLRYYRAPFSDPCSSAASRKIRIRLRKPPRLLCSAAVVFPTCRTILY